MSPFLVYMISWPASLIVLSLSAGADLKDRLIPNGFVIAVAAIGLGQSLVVRPGSAGLSLVAALVVFMGLGILAHYKFIGGGDLKLISAATLLVPPDRVGLLLLYIALAGGALSCVYLAAHFALKRIHSLQGAAMEGKPSVSGIGGMIKTERARILAGDSLPYALAVLGGVGSYVAREFILCSYATSCLR
jgi:prepilin peptidase CpaA